MNLILNFLLYSIARILAGIFIPIGILWVILFKFKMAKTFFWTLAISFDQLGNVACQYPLNFLFVKSGGNPHGDPDQTISFVIGQNKSMNKLKPFGKLMAMFLNLIEKNHVENAVENEKNNITDKYKSL